ncbi:MULTISPECIES: hypothetical protein [unclassified Enterococcus]|uniref:hypothetical protein n=1 Tax=unclassified Enterococcus TaxID=2608891 RepID=UPI0013EDAF05|nr:MULTISPECIES: hypothetical protein [unclassified Enterococcus]
MFEFESIMSGIDALLEAAKAELAQQQKNLEKQLIRSLVARPSKATSQTRKKLTRKRKAQGIETLKSASRSYKNSFSTSAEGKWVDAAKEAVQQVTDQFAAL